MLRLQYLLSLGWVTNILQVDQVSSAVHKAPVIPSVAVETAFISRPDEEAKLRSDGY